MLLVIEIALAIAGLIALFGGKMQLSKSKAVRGIPARLLGLLALTPLPVALVAVLIYTLMNVNLNDPAAAERFVNDNKVTITIIEAVCVIGIGVVIVIILAIIGRPVAELERQARRKRVDDYDDYESDRRHDRDRDDDEDDRPRRRRERFADDEEDDRPRSRHDDFDDRSR